MVRLAGVSKSYPDAAGAVPVLEDVDLTIGVGDKASLVGPSGSGKSTLLGLVAGLLRPYEGEIEMDGTSITGLSDRERARIRADRIGIALQADNLVPFLTARENVELALSFASGRRHRRRSHRADQLLERFAVDHRSGHRPRHLSGGEAQRVALAVAMANEPDLLLADEVVAQLDEATAAQVIDEVLTADFAVLFVSHDVALADLADHRYVLADRRVLLR